MGPKSYLIGGNLKGSKQSAKVDQKSLETVFLLPFVAIRATNGNLKLCF